MGGAVLVVGKFVMNGGIIEGGKAIPIAGYNAKGQPVNNRGYGGNLLARGAATVELNGGIIRNGYAGSAGGNLYIDGTAELLLNGTQIQGGYVDGRGCNGGSIYVGGKASVTMSGGSVTGGWCFNEGGNIYCGGTFTMQGGYIGGGTVYTYGTGKVKENNSSQNMFLVNGTLNHYGGTIAGGVHAIDTSKTRVCTVVLAGSPVIDGGKDCKANLNLNANGDGVKLVVGKLTDYARIGVSSVGIFSEKTDKANADNFFSDVGGEVIHYQERLAVGKIGCICGSKTHYGACDGTEQLWMPHTKDNTLPVKEGFWYLTRDIQLAGQQNIRGKQNVALDLNGHTVTSADGARAYAIFDPEEPSTLTLTDSSKEKTGTIKAVGQNVDVEGQCVWIRTAGQTLNLYDVTLDASGAVNLRRGGALYANAGTIVNMYAGRILGGTAQAVYRESSKAVVNGMGGNVYTNGIFIMYGGTISGGKALAAQNTKNVYVGGVGGNLATGTNAQVALLGGTIEGGHADTSGGNLYVSGSKSVLLKGTAISGGVSGNEERKLTGSGGNIAATGNLALESGSVTGGKTTGNGGNIHLTAAASGTIAGGTVSGGTAARGGNISVFGKLAMSGGSVTGGSAGAGGNVFVYGGEAAFTGGSLEKGTATGNGGNLYVGADGAAVQLGGTALSGGSAGKGGNLAMAQKCEVVLTAGALTGGVAATNGGNVYAQGGVLGIQGGTIQGGEAATGGNIYADSGVTMAQSGGTVTGGKATSNGGNLYISGGAAYTLLGGTVEKGVITKDGAGNIDVRGTLNMTGGTVSGGVRVDEKGQTVGSSDSKINLFAYKGNVNISGGKIDGGVLIYTGSTTLKLSKDAYIASSEAGKPGLTLNDALITLGSLSEKAEIVISNGENTKLAAGGSKTALASDKGLLVSQESGGLYLRAHTHCTVCGQTDGKHAEGCTGLEEARNLWNGGDITENGTYCIHETVQISKPAEITATGVTILVEGKLTSTKRALNIKSGAEVALTGSGIIEGEGANNENTGVVIVDGKLTIDGVTLQQIANASVNVKNGGVLTVGGTGEVIMNSGFIQGGKTINGGGNVFVNGGSFTLKGGTIQNGVSGVGGNIFLYGGGSFTMADDGKDATIPLITGGYATGKNGGNVNIGANSQFTQECGSVENGYNSGGDGVGNIYVGGTLNISGGTISGGYRVENDGVTLNTASQTKGNVFVVNGTMNLTGGSVDGGVETYGSAKLTVGKDGKLFCTDSAKPGLTLGSGTVVTVDTDTLTENAKVVLSFVRGTLSDGLVVAQSKDNKTMPQGVKSLFGADAGGLITVGGTKYKLTLESDNKLHLRGETAHVHCLCGRTDGTHAEGCGGWDVYYTAWEETDSLPDNGTYYLNLKENETVTLGSQHWIGRQNDTAQKHLTLCLNGETVQSASTSTERVVMVWTTSRFTLTDCGTTGTIRAGSAVAQDGANVYVAGTMDMYAGTITGGSASGNKNGGNVDVPGTMNLHGGTISNGRATNGGGNLRVQGTLNMTGGLITGGEILSGTNVSTNAGHTPKRNIFVFKGTINMSGGQIDGGVMIYNTGSNVSTLKVSGSATICSTDSRPSLTLTGGPVIKIGTAGLNNKASIRISGLAKDTVFAVAESGTLDSGVTAFFSHDDGYTPTLENNQLLFK